MKNERLNSGLSKRFSNVYASNNAFCRVYDNHYQLQLNRLGKRLYLLGIQRV